MSWIQENKVPAAIIGVTGAGVLGLGVMLFNAWSSATTAEEDFGIVNASLAGLKSATLAPTPENLAKKQALVKEYSDSVGKMSKVLYTLQPEDKPLSNTGFQAKLKTMIAEIKKTGTGRLPAEFNLCFDQYTNELPKSDEVATQLSGYLDSIDSILRVFLTSGVRSVDVLERSDLPSEKAEPASADARSSGNAGRGAAEGESVITERRQVRAIIRCDQAALQTITSKLASPADMPYFTVVRLLRIENESQVGPLRAAAALGPSVNPDDAPAPEPEAAAAAAPVQPETKANTNGVQPAPNDSKVVLGKETLRAYLEIDLVKFLPPPTSAQPKR